MHDVETAHANESPATLYRLDPRDGSVLETIGPVGFVTSLAFHPGHW